MRATNTQGLEKRLGGFSVLNNYNPHIATARGGETRSTRGYWKRIVFR